jgi:tRNA1Val (adenine37-N6)-methyltransferase
MSVSKRRNLARHQDSISYSLLMSISSRLLHSGGRIAIVFRGEEFQHVLDASEAAGAFPVRMMKVFTRKGKPNHLMLAEFTFIGNRERCESPDVLYIHDEKGKFSDEYISLTRDFYLDF